MAEQESHNTTSSSRQDWSGSSVSSPSSSSRSSSSSSNEGVKPSEGKPSKDTSYAIGHLKKTKTNLSEPTLNGQFN